MLFDPGHVDTRLVSLSDRQGLTISDTGMGSVRVWMQAVGIWVLADKSIVGNKSLILKIYFVLNILSLKFTLFLPVQL